MKDEFRNSRLQSIVLSDSIDSTISIDSSETEKKNDTCIYCSVCIYCSLCIYCFMNKWLFHRTIEDDYKLYRDSNNVCCKCG